MWALARIGRPGPGSVPRRESSNPRRGRGAREGASPGRWAILMMALSWPELIAAQGTVVFHNTGNGQSLVSEVQSILVQAGLQQPRLVFDFGFATDERPAPGSFLDSFTVTLQDSAQSFSAVYLTADATGVAWAPPTPGALFIDPASITARPITYPNLQPSLASQTAFEVSAPIPPQFLGSSVNLYFDLFDNLDSRISQGWFSGVNIVAVPEPQALALLLAGGLLLRLARRGRGRGQVMR